MEARWEQGSDYKKGPFENGPLEVVWLKLASLLAAPSKDCTETEEGQESRGRLGNGSC